jgi:hypothetical protein
MSPIRDFNSGDELTFAEWFTKHLPSIKTELLRINDPQVDSALIADKVITQLLQQLLPIDKLDTAGCNFLLASDQTYNKLRQLFIQLCSYGVTFTKSTATDRITQLIKQMYYDPSVFSTYDELETPSIIRFVPNTKPAVEFEPKITTPSLSFTPQYTLMLDPFTTDKGTIDQDGVEWLIAEDDAFLNTIYHLPIMDPSSDLLRELTLNKQVGMEYSTFPYEDSVEYDTLPVIQNPPDQHIGYFECTPISTGELDHDASIWYFYKDINCRELVYQITVDTDDKTKLFYNNHTHPLLHNTQYYVRVRHRSKLHGYYMSKLSQPFPFFFTGTQTPIITNGDGIALTESVLAINTPSLTIESPVTFAPLITAEPFTTSYQNITRVGLHIKTSEFSVGDGLEDFHLYSLYEIATDIYFSEIIYRKVTATDLTEHITDDPHLNLEVGRTYYVRCKHSGYLYGDSLYSPTFAAYIMVLVVPAPIIENTIVSPVNGTIVQCYLKQIQLDLGMQLVSTDWEFSLTPSFQSILHTANTTLANNNGSLFVLTVLSDVVMPLNTTIYWRAKYNASGPEGEVLTSGYSLASSFRLTVTIHKPSIITHNYGHNISPNFMQLITSPYEYSGIDNQHAKTEIRFYVTGTTTPVATIEVTTGNLTNIFLPLDDRLKYNRSYDIVIRYTSNQNAVSSWSDIYTCILHNEINKPTNLSVTGLSDSNKFIRLNASTMTTTLAYDEHVASEFILGTDPDLQTVLYQSGITTNLTSIEVPKLPGLEYGLTPYYFSVRHHGRILGVGPYANIYQFVALPGISKPTIITANICNVASCYFTFTGSPYVSSDINIIHTKSRLQLSTSSDFAPGTIVADITKTTDLRNFTISKALYSVLYNTTYYARLQYQGSNDGWSLWSDTRAIDNPNAILQPAQLYAQSSLVSTGIVIQLTSVDMQTSHNPVPHYASSWAVTSTNEPPAANNTILTSAVDTLNKLTKTFAPTTDLTFNTTYYGWVKHHATELGESTWTSTDFTTITVNNDYVRAESYTVCLTPDCYFTLFGSAFQPIIQGIGHKQTTYQISLTPDFSNPTNILLDKTSTTDLTSITIPKSDLPTFEYGRTYYWRLMYTDMNNQSTSFSPPSPLVVNTAIIKPTLTTELAVDAFVTLKGSPVQFTSNPTTHDSSRYEILSSTGDVLYDSGFITSLYSHTVPNAPNLTFNTNHAARVTYKSNKLTTTATSDLTVFRINKAISKPVILSVTANNTLNNYAKVTSSNYVPVNIGVEHIKSTYQIRANDDTILHTFTVSNSLTIRDLTNANFSSFRFNTPFKVLVRYELSDYTETEWSDPFTFTISNAWTTPNIGSLEIHQENEGPYAAQYIQIFGSDPVGTLAPLRVDKIKYEISTNASFTQIVKQATDVSSSNTILINHSRSGSDSPFIPGVTYYTRIAYADTRLDGYSPWSLVDNFEYAVECYLHSYSIGDIVDGDIVVRIERDINRILLAAPASKRAVQPWGTDEVLGWTYIQDMGIRTVPNNASYQQTVAYQQTDAVYNNAVLDRYGNKATAYMHAKSLGYRLPNMQEVRNIFFHEQQQSFIDNLDPSKTTHSGKLLTSIKNKVEHISPYVWTCSEDVSYSAEPRMITVDLSLTNFNSAPFAMGKNSSHWVVPVRDLYFLNRPVVYSYVPFMRNGARWIRVYYTCDKRFANHPTVTSYEVTLKASTSGYPTVTQINTTEEVAEFLIPNTEHDYMVKVVAKARIDANTTICSPSYTRLHVRPNTYYPLAGDRVSTGDFIYTIEDSNAVRVIAPAAKRALVHWGTGSLLTQHIRPLTGGAERTQWMVDNYGADAIAAKHCIDLGYVLPESNTWLSNGPVLIGQYSQGTEYAVTIGRMIDVADRVGINDPASLLNICNSGSRSAWTSEDVNAQLAYTIRLARSGDDAMHEKASNQWAIPVRRILTGELQPYDG